MLPPTAGLPLRAADLLPWGDADLATALAQWLGVPAVQLECSGTSALMVALQTLRRLAPGRSEVIAPAYTCPLVALAVAHCGLQLRLCDLHADTLDMDPARLRALCSERTLAVLPTHLCGRVADVATAVDCARAVGAWVVEDAAQALGARRAVWITHAGVVRAVQVWLAQTPQPLRARDWPTAACDFGAWQVRHWPDPPATG